MKISTNLSLSKNQTFCRRLNKNEEQGYKATIQQGLQEIDKELGIIIHNSTAPSDPNKNTGVGSLLSENTIDNVIPFLALHGITTIQQEPNNYRRSWDPSPYSPLTTGKNALMIPLEKLASDEYGNILTTSTFNDIVENRPNKEEGKFDFGYVVESYDRALQEAYMNFLLASKTAEPDSTIGKLAAEFAEYKAQNSEEQEPEAIFEILSKEHKTDDWKTWPEVDRNLYNATTEEGIAAANARLTQIRTDLDDNIGFYYFKQMLADKEIDAANKANEKSGIRIIADSPVAFTPVEEWQNQDLFLKDVALGCPPDIFAPEGQRWGFSVLNPEKIFNKDGSLGPAGKLMQKRYEKMFASSSGGARIDHVIGLVDPYVYSTKEDQMTPENSGRLYSSPNHPMFGDFEKKSIEEYKAILEKIVIPAAEKYGLTKKDIICEDLGQPNVPTQNVMKALELCGITVTQFGDRGQDTPAQKVIMIGSHDNKSLIEYCHELFDKAAKSSEEKSNLDKIVSEIAIGTYDSTLGSKNNYITKLSTQEDKLRNAFMTELFTSGAKRVQVFFTDFFGIGKTYNVPGQTKDCWTLRIPDNFEDMYAENLKEGRGFNMPELLARAINVKFKDTGLDSEKQALVDELKRYASILKE